MQNEQIDHKQVIVMRKDLGMRKGKMCAQAAHASMKAILDQCKKEKNKYTLILDDRIEPWVNGLFKKICVSVNNEKELLDIYNKALESGIICSLIRDAGLTEFNGIPTLTCVAVGPDRSDKIDAITGKLPLL